MFSISLESCEVKENASVCQAIVDEINSFFAGLSSEGSVSLEEAERRVLEVSRSFGQKCLTLVASEHSCEESCEAVKCPVPDCESVCRRWVKRPRYVSTLCGLLLVPRWVYRGCVKFLYKSMQLLCLDTNSCPRRYFYPNIAM